MHSLEDPQAVALMVIGDVGIGEAVAPHVPAPAAVVAKRPLFGLASA